MKIKAKTILGMLCFLGAGRPAAAAEFSAGAFFNGALNRAWRNFGQYNFTETNVKHNIQVARTISQEGMFSGGGGFVFTAKFTDWYALAPELAVSFNNGFYYYGNYDGSSNEIRPDGKPGQPGKNGQYANEIPLTGTLSYNWSALDLNLTSRLYFAQPNEALNVFFSAGPVFSFVLGQAKEIYIAERNAGSLNSPYPSNNEKKLPMQNYVNIGLTAGLGGQFSAGPGYIFLDMRTTWYFAETLKSYASQGKGVYFAKPYSINLGYAFSIN